jgi:hypothetical protein
MTGILLGEEWVVPEPPQAVGIPGFAEQELVDARVAEQEHKDHVEVLLSQIVERLRTLDRPPPDVSPTVAGPVMLDTTGLAGVITQALVGLPRSPDVSGELAAIVKALDKIDRRVIAGSGGGSVLNPDISDRAARQLGQVSITGTIPVTSGGLTNTELRAAAVPVSLATAPTTPVTGTFFQATQPVSLATTPGLTDTQLRATAVPVSGTVSVIPSGTWDYTAGTSGTVALTGGKKVHSVAVTATVAGSMKINGGATITIPAGTPMSFGFDDGKLTNPTFVFTSTASYYIDWYV